MHSKTDLTVFFNQWLSRWDVPEVKASWQLSEQHGETLLKLRFEQLNEIPYALKIPVVARSADGQIFQTDLMIEKQISELELKLTFKPVSVEIDPLRENLMKLSVKGKSS
jgi:hypothetical protein